MHLITRAKASIMTVLTAILTGFWSIAATVNGEVASAHVAATAPHGGFASRRAMLASLREQRAHVNPVAEIAIGGILFAIAILIVLRFYPLMTSVVAEAQADANSTASDNSLLGLIPTLFVVFLLMGGVSLVVHGIKGLKTDL